MAVSSESRLEEIAAGAKVEAEIHPELKHEDAVLEVQNFNPVVRSEAGALRRLPAGASGQGHRPSSVPRAAASPPCCGR